MSSKSVSKIPSKNKVMKVKVKDEPKPLRSSRSRRSGGPPAADPRVAEKILLKRVLGGELQYFVKWKDLGDVDNSWEAASDLGVDLGSSDLVQEFEKQLEAKSKQQEEVRKKVEEENRKLAEAKRASKRKYPWLEPEPTPSPKAGRKHWIPLPQGGEGDDMDAGGEGASSSDGVVVVGGGGGRVVTPDKMKSLKSPASSHKYRRSNSSTAATILTTPTKGPQWYRLLREMQQAEGNKQSWAELLRETDWLALEGKLRANYNLDDYSSDDGELFEELQDLAKNAVTSFQKLVEFGVKVSKDKE